MAIKRKAKGERKEREIKIEIDSTERLLDYIQLAENYVLSVGNLFLAIPILTSRKTVQKGGFGPKCNWLTVKGKIVQVC